VSDLVLMTGATGFVGRRLLRVWLEKTPARIVVLTRPQNGNATAARCGVGDPKLAEDFSRRVKVLAADLTDPQLGLPPVLRSDLATEVTDIVHCGGLVRFDASLADARATNTAGTAAMLELARQCPRLRRFDHISTAFVAGCRKGVIREDELDVGQRHHNGYERSKLEAELLVHKAAAELPTTVHRPSIITCDTATGELAPFGAVARLLGAYASGSLTVLPGHPDTHLDLVPVDYVTDAVFAIAADAASLGGCFHLAAGRDRSPNLGEVRDLAAAHFQRPPLLIGGDTSTLPTAIRAEVELYAPYLTSDLDFAVTETGRFLDKAGVVLPAFADYFAAMARGVRSLTNQSQRTIRKQSRFIR